MKRSSGHLQEQSIHLKNNESCIKKVGLNSSTMRSKFQTAVESDSQEVLQTDFYRSKTTSNVYYLVSKLWMNDFLLFDSSESKTPLPGKIENIALLESDIDIIPPSDSDMESSVSDQCASEDPHSSTFAPSVAGENSQSKESNENWPIVGAHQNLDKKSLKQNLVHGIDYVIVGKKAWTYLKSKFGCDVVVPVYARFLSEKEK